MINKIVDECQKLKGIVKTDTFCLIDTKELVTVVIRTINNNYLCYYEVDYINFDYDDNTFYVYDINNGYSTSIQNCRIKQITIL